jgi:hypothetical protein
VPEEPDLRVDLLEGALRERSMDKPDVGEPGEAGLNSPLSADPEVVLLP